MVICRNPLILGVDLAGLAATALLAALVALCIVVPLKRDLDVLPDSRKELAAAQDRLTQLVAANQATEEALRARDELLRAQASQPLADVGTFLAHMSEECQRSGVTLQQVQPLATNRGEEYQSWDVLVHASGAFPAFTRLLRGIEARSPYVQVEDIVVTGPASAADSECALAWTVRVNSLTGGTPPEGRRP